MDILKVKRLRETAIMPTRATTGSAGYDLYADISEEILINPGTTVKIGTGIAIALPTELAVGLVYARSGLATKNGVKPANCVGVIDSDYRGELIVALCNQSDLPYLVRQGERIAQLVIAPVYLPALHEVDDLDDTKRGEGGFGSTS